MAVRRLSLMLCFVVVFLCLASVIRGSQIESSRRYGVQGERESRNPYIYKRDEHQRRLATQRGEIRAVPIFRESSSLVEDLKNFELNCIRIRPNSFMLPHYSSARRLLFVEQGKAKVGWVKGGKLREVQLERGSVHFIPLGSVFYAINNDQSQTLVIVNLLHNPNPLTRRHHESFYVAGGRNPPSILSAFRRETLEAAFNTEGQQIQSLLSKQNEGVFASLEQGKKSILSADNNIGIWKRKSRSAEEEYKPFNLLKKSPMFSNDNGQFIFADDEDLVKGPLDREDIGIAYTRIEPQAMVVPHWETHSTRISVVVKGSGRLEIASPEGAQQQRRREAGGESESEREREKERESESESERERERKEEEEEGEFRLSYKRVEENLKEGDVFVVPAGHPSSQIASSNQRLEILTFHINNDDRNEINFLAGKNSAMSDLRNDILAASFNEREEVVKKVFESQKEEMFVKGPSSAEREGEGGTGARAIL